MENLEKYGVVQMKRHELSEVEGGMVLALTLAALYLAGTMAAAYQGKNAHLGY